MKKIYLLIIALSFILISPNNLKANDLGEQLKGRILLQVEEHGEAWYVNPDTKKRHFLGRPADAFNLMRQLGIGISEADYYSFNNYAPQRLSGKILLRVHANGEAYYVNPVDLRMHFLGRPADAFHVMRTLGLGISNSNLARINEVSNIKTYVNEDLGFSFQYPENISININNNNVLSLSVKSEKINSLNYPMNYNKETAKLDRISLSQGNYGQGPDWPLDISKKVRNIYGPINAQEFMVLSRFEICDVTFERRLIFYYDDHQVIITLYGNKNNIISENPSYFKFDQINCSNQKIWDSSKQNQFYNDLNNNLLSGNAQNWFNLFDNIIETINF